MVKAPQKDDFSTALPTLYWRVLELEHRKTILFCYSIPLPHTGF